MPSPPVPSRTFLPSSTSRSAVSAPPLSRFSSTWTRKVNFLRKKPQELSKDSTLNREILEEHNRRFHDVVDKRCSPYYKGLTDSSLVTNKNNNNNNNNNRPGSPESHATAQTGTSSLYFIVSNKVQEWGSCFSGKTKKHQFAEPPPAPVIAPARPVSPTLTSLGARVTAVKELAKETTVEKPLRERVSPQKPTQEEKDEEYGEARIEVVHNKVSDIDDDDKVEYTWADKYRPKSLNDFICNRDKAMYLKQLTTRGDSGHFIFEGPAGVGKRTMIWAMLAEPYNNNNNNNNNGGHDKLQGREELMKGGLEHVEVNLAEYLEYEKLVNLIKEAQTNKDVVRSRAIIIYEAEKMSGDALLYIRWLLERYKGYNKVYLCCSDISKLHPLKSISTTIHLLPPSNAEIIRVLKFIAMQESINLPTILAERITLNSKNNLRQAIRSFEATCRFCCSFPLTDHQLIFTGWEEDIANIAKNIVKEQSSRQLYTIRNELQNLTEHNVSPEFIFKTLVEELKKHLDEEQHPLVDNLYREYNSNDKSSSIHAYNRPEEIDGKPTDCSKFFFRIEEFIAKFMSTYKSLLKNKKMEQDDDSG